MFEAGWQSPDTLGKATSIGEHKVFGAVGFAASAVSLQS